MTTHHDRDRDSAYSAREYEREAEQTRKRLAQNLDEQRSRVRLCRGQAIDVEIALIADNHPALGVKHDEPLRHVGEGGVE